MKIPKNSLEQPFITEIRNRVMHIESPLTLPPDSGSVIKAIKRVNLQIKIWLQSLNQHMAFSSFHGWKWCNEKLIIAPVWFTGSQLRPTVMKRSHKFQVAKRMYI